MLGSFPGTIIFFGVYEYSKRHMIDFGIRPQLAYLTGGMISNTSDNGKAVLTYKQDSLQI